MHAKRARRSLQWHNTWAARATEYIFKYSQTQTHNDARRRRRRRNNGKVVSVVRDRRARFRRKMSQCEVYRVIATTQSTNIDFPLFAKTPNRKVSGNSRCCRRFNFRCWPWSSADETSARRKFFSRHSQSHANRIGCCRIGSSIRGRVEFIN